MKTLLLAAGAAALALSAGQALANTHHKHHKGAMTSATAEPKQPIPYAQLSAYLKASPSQRAKKDWWSGQSMASNSSASTAGANASATTAGSTSATTSPSSSDTTTGAEGSTASPTTSSSSSSPAPSSTSGSALPPATTGSTPSDTSSTTPPK